MVFVVIARTMLRALEVSRLVPHKCNNPVAEHCCLTRRHNATGKHMPIFTGSRRYYHAAHNTSARIRSFVMDQ